MENMEKALMIWVEDQNQKRIPIDRNAIQNKALINYDTLQNQTRSISVNKVAFNACHGWFQRFKQRHSLHSLKFNNLEDAQKYPQKFAEIIGAKSYSPDQIFNADESDLFSKKMPERTFLAKQQKR